MNFEERNSPKSTRSTQLAGHFFSKDVSRSCRGIVEKRAETRVRERLTKRGSVFSVKHQTPGGPELAGYATMPRPLFKVNLEEVYMNRKSWEQNFLLSKYNGSC